MRLRKDGYLRYTAYGLLMFVLFIFQSTPGLMPQIRGILPILLIPFVCCVALFEGEITGAYFGLAAGILLDMYSTYTYPLGMFMLFIAGCVCGLLSKHLMAENLLSVLTLTLSTLFVYLNIQYLLTSVLRGVDNSLHYYINHQLPTLVYSMILLVPIYYTVRKITRVMKV